MPYAPLTLLHRSPAPRGWQSWLDLAFPDSYRGACAVISCFTCPTCPCLCELSTWLAGRQPFESGDMSLGYAEKLSFRADVGTVGMPELFDSNAVLDSKVCLLRCDIACSSKHLFFSFCNYWLADASCIRSLIFLHLPCLSNRLLLAAIPRCSCFGASEIVCDCLTS